MDRTRLSTLLDTDPVPWLLASDEPSGVWVTLTRAENRMAVVTQRDAVMRLGPFEESQSALDLKNGAELRVLDRKQDWIQVTPDNRQLGWLPATSVRIIEP